ncbi:PAS domain-containing protein [Sphingomonas daechungensis]|uniref:PAS domain-containing protein n=1 Tax=Sphingomonas daechungensis TaxID=1176646 RepID=UPI003784FE7D
MQGADGHWELSELRESIHHSPIPTIVTDCRLADNPIVEANDAFLDLTGYRRNDVMGKNCRFLAGKGTEPEAQDVLRTAVASGEPAIVELTNYRKDGSAFRNAVMLAPVRAEDGSVAMFIGSQMEVAAVSRPRQAKALERIRTLTPRLRQTLELVAMGYRNKQIGGFLGIEEKTVKMHRSRLIEALGVKTTADAIRIAVEAEIVPTGRD